MNKGISRRQFLKVAGAGVVAPYVITSCALGAGGRPAASERIVMAAIGVGGQGTGDMNHLMGFREVQMVATCDPVPAHRERAKNSVDKKYGHGDCKAYSDFREVIARKDIDAVLIGTPDHWHAIITIAACKSGKDVYCEKPECLTIREGRAMVEAARRHARVVSGGSQRVLGDYGNWPWIVRSGALGQIREVFVNCGGPSGECDLKPQPIPPGVDWDMWLGPAPWRPFHENLIRGGFRPYRDYSGGGMTDWGAHRFGAAMFHLGVHLTGPVEIIPPRDKGELLTFVWADGMKMYHGGTSNITYVGSVATLGDPSTRGKGNIKAARAKAKQTMIGDPAKIRALAMELGYKGQGGIMGDFLHCVRTRQRPFRDIEIGHRACTTCHLGNLAYWLGRPLKWDPVKEEILNDPLASRWLDRAKREPWSLDCT